MDQDPPRNGNSPLAPGCLIPAALAALSETAVLAGHLCEWPVAIPIILALAIAGVMIGSLGARSIFEPLLAMMLFAGLAEGICRGVAALGWPGAIIGGLIGLVVGPILGCLGLAALFLVALMGEAISQRRNSHPLHDAELDDRSRPARPRRTYPPQRGTY